MATFLAIYRGKTIGAAKVVAVSANPKLVAYVATNLLTDIPPDCSEDPVVDELDRGRRRALRLISEGC